LLAERRAWMQALFDAMRTTGAGGGGPWQFAYDSRPDDEYTFRWVDGTEPADPRNEYADVVLAAGSAP
jgi:mannan endo-1,4-beta-mannosidase